VGTRVVAIQTEVVTRSDLRFVPVEQDDPLAEPLLDDLAVEYATRYGGTTDGVARWLRTAR
jgi:hypothetical protein